MPRLKIGVIMAEMVRREEDPTGHLNKKEESHVL